MGKKPLSSKKPQNHAVHPSLQHLFEVCFIKENNFSKTTATINGIGFKGVETKDMIVLIWQKWEAIEDDGVLYWKMIFLTTLS